MRRAGAKRNRATAVLACVLALWMAVSCFIPAAAVGERDGSPTATPSDCPRTEDNHTITFLAVDGCVFAQGGETGLREVQVKVDDGETLTEEQLPHVVPNSSWDVFSAWQDGAGMEYTTQELLSLTATGDVTYIPLLALRQATGSAPAKENAPQEAENGGVTPYAAEDSQEDEWIQDVKVYMKYDNSPPETINAADYASDYGPSGNDTPYFTVSVNMTQLERAAGFSRTGGAYWYFSAENSGDRYADNKAGYEALWKLIDNAMSKEDQAKFQDTFGPNVFVGYVLNRQADGYHIDGYANVELPHYQVEITDETTGTMLPVLGKSSDYTPADIQAMVEAHLTELYGGKTYHWSDDGTAVDFWSADNHSYTVTLTPVGNTAVGKGRSVSPAAGYYVSAFSLSTREATPTVQINAKKTLDGEIPEDGQFTFGNSLQWAADARGKDLGIRVYSDIKPYLDLPGVTNDELTMVAKNTADGSINFPEITVKKDGTYIFELFESPTTAQKDVYECDSNRFYVKVVVKDGQKTISYYSAWNRTGGADGFSHPVAPEDVVFVNRTLPDLTVTKEVTGNLGDQEKPFTFNISAANVASPLAEQIYHQLCKMLADPTYLVYPNLYTSKINGVTTPVNPTWYYYYGRTGSGGLDSTGKNYGMYITAMLATVIPELDGRSCYWQLYLKSKSGNGFSGDTFYFYCCDDDISAMKSGDLVRVDRYNTKTGEVSTGTAKVKENKNGEMDIMVLDSNSYKAYSDLTGHYVLADGTRGETISLNDGSADITLKAGESFVVDRLSFNAYYSITETDYSADGYTTTVSSNDGNTQINGNQSYGTSLQEGGTDITYTNSRNIAPPTGITVNPSASALVAWGGVLLGGGAWIAGLRRKRKERANRAG